MYHPTSLSASVRTQQTLMPPGSAVTPLLQFRPLALPLAGYAGGRAAGEAGEKRRLGSKGSLVAVACYIQWCFGTHFAWNIHLAGSWVWHCTFSIHRRICASKTNQFFRNSRNTAKVRPMKAGAPGCLMGSLLDPFVM